MYRYLISYYLHDWKTPFNNTVLELEEFPSTEEQIREIEDKLSIKNVEYAYGCFIDYKAVIISLTLLHAE